MKEIKEGSKITLLYDKLSLLSFLIPFLVALFGNILIIVFKWEYNPHALRGHYHLMLKHAPFWIFPFLLFQLRFRKITSKGVYATFIGIPYKHISWDKVAFCKIDSAKPWICGDRQKEYYRDMIFFKSRLNRRYKATIISIDATPETIALVKKYYKKEIYDLTQNQSIETD